MSQRPAACAKLAPLRRGPQCAELGYGSLSPRPATVSAELRRAGRAGADAGRPWDACPHLSRWRLASGMAARNPVSRREKMPLARIITRTPQDAVGASEYLRSLGYTVETVSPEEFRITPAELELNLDRCGAAEAVERALALVDSGAAVAAEIEALPAPEPTPPQKAKIPIAYDITGRPVEFADEERLESRPRHSGLGSVLAAVATWLRPWSNSRQRRAEQHALKLEAQAARQREEVRRQEDLARERLRQETERQRQAAELVERRQEQLAAEQQEQARIAALHEARIAAERETPQEQPLPLVPPSESTPVVTEETAGDNLTVLAAPSAPRPKAEPAPVAEVVRQQVSRLQRPRPVQARRRRSPIAISRTAVATACGLSLLLIMGFVAYANRRPVSPFLPGALTNVKQDVPFGAASVTPSAIAAPPRRVAPGKRPAAAHAANRKPPAGQPAARQLRRPSQDDPHDEVAVRHFQPAQPRPQPSTAKLKRHSDLD